MTQYASVAIQDDVPVESMRLMVRGHHDRKSRSFTDVIFEMRLEGKASADQVKSLARRASDDCFVENTLAKAIPVTTQIFLNGEKVLTLARKPGDR